MTATEPIRYDPLAPGYGDDPYAQFAALREHDPVHRTPLGSWMLFAHDDVFHLLRDARLSVDDRNASPARPDRFEELTGRSRRASRSMLFLDPPDHDRLRKLVSRAFTPRAVEAFRPRARTLVQATLDEMADAGRAEIIADLAFPLPFQVISELLGMPDEDVLTVRDWSHAMVKTLDPINSDEEIVAAVTAGEAMRAHLAEVIEWKRTHPADDMLTALITAEEDGDRLSADELVTQVTLLFVAGHETTVNLIGNGLRALLTHRDQLEDLVARPELIENAVEELLRFDPPVQISGRIATVDLDLGGRRIPAGAFVAAVLASANRDPARFGPTADRLDLTRTDANRHLSFGGGVHHCLGAALARLEAQEAIGGFVARFPRAHLEPGPIAWNGRINLRGVAALPVALG